jgi:tetrahydromethanopterin S-methyltransferase subunit E
MPKWYGLQGLIIIIITCKVLSHNELQEHTLQTQCTALHCTALHCTALHCTALHCTLAVDAALRQLVLAASHHKPIPWQVIKTHHSTTEPAVTHSITSS